MTISELAASTGLSKHTLRYYERAGLVPLVGRHPSSGHRTYTAHHAEWIGFVRNLRTTGMPIRELRRYDALVPKGDRSWPERKAMLAAHRSRIVAAIAVLERQRKVLDRKLALGCAPSGFGATARAVGSAARARALVPVST